MSDSKIISLVTRARTTIILDHVFFATLILKLICTEDAKIKTACTDGKRIKYNPTYFGTLQMKEIVTVLAHEILHCVFGHHTRRGNRNPKIWYKACDLAINPLLLEYEFKLPHGALLEPSLKGMTAEQIYDLIMRDNNGASNYRNMETGDDGGLGEVEDAKDENGKTAEGAEKNYQEVDWKIAVTQAANLASKAGNLPDGMKRLIEEHISPHLPWEEILYKYMDGYSYNNFSWLPPNRKYMSSGLYLPSVRSRELKNIYFGCDSSGSIRNSELGLISSSLDYLSQTFQADIKVLWFDTKVHHEQNFMVGDIVKLEPKGGGGTDFKAPFDYMNENGIYPNVLIMFTDMECYSYPKTPEFPVIWVTWKKHYQQPPFGKVIIM